MTDYYRPTRMIEIRDALLAELGEINFMHHAVNHRRSERGLPNVDRDAIVRVEQWACGHSDYSSKFALYCAELVLGTKNQQP